MGVNTEKEPVLTWGLNEDPGTKFDITLEELWTHEKELKRVVNNAVDDFILKIWQKEIWEK